MMITTMMKTIMTMNTVAPWFLMMMMIPFESYLGPDDDLADSGFVFESVHVLSKRCTINLMVLPGS